MIAGIIPARYASTRFPGKPLVMIEGKSMIHRVYDQAAKSNVLDRLVVATDDERIARHVRDFGGEVVITAAYHQSGTDRCAEAAQKLGITLSSGGSGGEAYIINIQGDEPFIDPSQFDTLATVLKDGTTEIATLIVPVDNKDVLFDAGEAKVLLNPKMEAIYFSRSAIPYLKDVPFEEWHLRRAYYRHAGLYAFRPDILWQITKLAVSSLEKAESLEQLRWIEAGYKIKCAITHHDSHGIDTPEDIEKVLKLMKGRKA